MVKVKTKNFKPKNLVMVLTLLLFLVAMVVGVLYMTFDGQTSAKYLDPDYGSSRAQKSIKCRAYTTKTSCLNAVIKLNGFSYYCAWSPSSGCL